MRRIMMTIGSAVLVLGSSMIADGQDKGPVQQAPKQAPMQAPTQKIAPMQAPAQAPTQKHTQAPTQAHVQKHVQKPMASDQVVPNDQIVMSRPSLFRRYR